MNLEPADHRSALDCSKTVMFLTDWLRINSHLTLLHCFQVSESEIVCTYLLWLFILVFRYLNKLLMPRSRLINRPVMKSWMIPQIVQLVEERCYYFSKWLDVGFSFFFFLEHIPSEKPINDPHSCDDESWCITVSFPILIWFPLVWICGHARLHAPLTSIQNRDTSFVFVLHLFLN